MWEEVEAAAKLLSRPKNPISMKERDRECSRIRKEIEKLEAEIDRLTIEFREIGRNGQDIREAYVSLWQDTQALAREPVGAFGFSLQDMEPDEQEAWTTLGIKGFVNRRGLLPAK